VTVKTGDVKKAVTFQGVELTACGEAFKLQHFKIHRLGSTFFTKDIWHQKIGILSTFPSTKIKHSGKGNRGFPSHSEGWYTIYAVGALEE